MYSPGAYHLSHRLLQRSAVRPARFSDQQDTKGYEYSCPTDFQSAKGLEYYNTPSKTTLVKSGRPCKVQDTRPDVEIAQ